MNIFLLNRLENDFELFALYTIPNLTNSLNSFSLSSLPELILIE